MYEDKKIALIVAFDKKTRTIGKGNKLLWHIPQDLKFFKKKTLEHAIIVGRKTFDSIGKPLPNRYNITLTRELRIDKPSPEYHYCYSIKEALDSALEYSRQNNLQTIFGIGGGEIYQQLMPYADTLFITEVNDEKKPIKGDTFFPEINEKEWLKYSTDSGSNGKLSWQFIKYDRKPIKQKMAIKKNTNQTTMMLEQLKSITSKNG